MAMTGNSGRIVPHSETVAQGGWACRGERGAGCLPGEPRHPFIMSECRTAVAATGWLGRPSGEMTSGTGRESWARKSRALVGVALVSGGGRTGVSDTRRIIWDSSGLRRSE